MAQPAQFSSDDRTTFVLKLCSPFERNVILAGLKEKHQLLDMLQMLMCLQQLHFLIHKPSVTDVDLLRAWELDCEVTFGSMTCLDKHCCVLVEANRLCSTHLHGPVLCLYQFCGVEAGSRVLHRLILRIPNDVLVSKFKNN